MTSKLAGVSVLAAAALGIAGGLGFSSLGDSDSVPDAAAIAAPPAVSRSQDVSRPRTALSGGIPSVVERVQPVVVSVLVETSDGGAEGSGVVFDGRKGLVVTNAHVVADAVSVEVVLANGERLDARVRATDPLTDIAVLSVDRSDLPQARFADDLPRVGELAIALGNPLGFENSVTAGIVSGLHRVIPSGGQTPSLVDLIQTDAPISPGNSGGALVDAAGSVIGINVAAIPPTPDTRAASIGFAIPARTAASVVRQLLETGQARHAFLGIQPANLTPDVVRRFDVEAEEGVLVVSVAPGGAAARAGLRRGDVIVAFKGHPIRILEDLFGTLRRYRPGDRIVLTVVRGDERLSLRVVLRDRTGN